MPKPQADPILHKNQLLGAFEPAVRAKVMGFMQPVTLKLGAVVCESGGILNHVYFPQGAVLSLLTVLENGSAIECANIGREGAFGLFAAMYSRASFNQCVVQLKVRHSAVLSNPCTPRSKKASTFETCSSAIQRHCYRRSCRRSAATPFIPWKNGCAVGFS